MFVCLFLLLPKSTAMVMAGRSKFRGWVISDMLGGSFRPIFRVCHFGLWLFWPKSESDNVCIIICV